MSSNANKATDNPGSKAYTTASISSYYDLLGIKPNASVQEIRRAYRDMSKLYHPDTTKLESAIAIPKFQALNEAYATLSSPEKRLAYDYKSGYSRISVMQPLSSQKPQPGKSVGPHDWSASAYLDPNDRPLSAGEMFALFILGITFVGCLVLVITISLTQDDLGSAELDALMNSGGRAVAEPHSQKTAAPESLLSPFKPELPDSRWLVPKAPEI